ncbi:MAG TPA: M3 family metallopeptidase, partial [Haliangiales bacterium]|nr:M3 family metallopeptidase [Haliangiales bacterium]
MVRWALLCAGLAACGPKPSATPHAMTTPHETFLASCRAELAEARTDISAIKSAGKRTVETVLVPYDRVLTVVDRWSSRATLFSEVHPDARMREAAEACVKDTAAFQAEYKLDRALHDALAAVPAAPHEDRETKRFLERTLRDFRRAGVDKDEAARARLKALNDEITAVQLDFAKNIREDVHRVKLDPAELAGMPADYIDAHKPGADGKVEITTDYPDFYPFMQYAESGAARKRLYLEFLNRGYPKNGPVLKQLLAARKEFATILGYRNWADYITEDKMVRSAAYAQSFIDKIAAAADARTKGDVAALLERRRRDDPTAQSVAGWDQMYYTTLVKKETLDFDPQSVRPYFDFAATRDGLLRVTGKLFGVDFRKVTDAEVWHPSVDVYDVYQGDEKLGRIYLDLHPRADKFKHAAQFALVAGVAGRQLPEGVLVCNFPDPAAGPALMDHNDVVVMFHEFGHLVHYIFAGKQRWVYFSGVSTEWDFVEAPSQMLEEWAWDPEVLALFARDKDTGKPIPAELVARMRAAQDFGKGIQARQQMFYAATSLGLHEADPASLDVDKLTVETQRKYSPWSPVPETHFWAGFGHLTEYSAMYYTYMWSLVIAKDLFTPFHNNGLFDAATAKRYRDAIL